MIGALLGASVASSAIQGAVNYGMQKDQQAFTAEQNELSRQWTSSENQATRDFNALEAQKNRDWQTQMSNTAYQRQVEDMKAAGLNVGAIGSGGGASSPSSSAASAQNSLAPSIGSSVASHINSPDFSKALGAVMKDNFGEWKSQFLAANTRSAYQFVNDFASMLWK